jgi:hypothetical protein
MRVVDVTLKLLGLTDALSKLQSVIAGAGDRRRERIARYACEIAGTLARAATAFETLENKPGDKAALRSAVREFGRLRGYVENITDTLNGRIDGRRLAGIKRRLESIASEGLIVESLGRVDPDRIERLAAAEGYFRALADSART